MDEAQPGDLEISEVLHLTQLKRNTFLNMEIYHAQNVGKFQISGNLPAPSGTVSGKSFHGTDTCKKPRFSLLFSMVVQWLLFNRFGALAAIHPWWVLCNLPLEESIQYCQSFGHVQSLPNPQGHRNSHREINSKDVACRSISSLGALGWGLALVNDSKSRVFQTLKDTTRSQLLDTTHQKCPLLDLNKAL